MLKGRAVAVNCQGGEASNLRKPLLIPLKPPPSDTGFGTISSLELFRQRREVDFPVVVLLLATGVQKPTGFLQVLRSHEKQADEKPPSVRHAHTFIVEDPIRGATHHGIAPQVYLHALTTLLEMPFPRSPAPGA
jgi:hypothetical protein